MKLKKKEMRQDNFVEENIFTDSIFVMSRFFAT